MVHSNKYVEIQQEKNSNLRRNAEADVFQQKSMSKQIQPMQPICAQLKPVYRGHNIIASLQAQKSKQSLSALALIKASFLHQSCQFNISAPITDQLKMGSDLNYKDLSLFKDHRTWVNSLINIFVLVISDKILQRLLVALLIDKCGLSNIKQDCALLNSGGGIIFFDCNRDNFDVLPQGQYGNLFPKGSSMIESQKETIIRRVKSILQEKQAAIDTCWQILKIFWSQINARNQQDKQSSSSIFSFEYQAVSKESVQQSQMFSLDLDLPELIHEQKANWRSIQQVQPSSNNQNQMCSKRHYNIQIENQAGQNILLADHSHERDMFLISLEWLIMDVFHDFLGSFARFNRSSDIELSFQENQEQYQAFNEDMFLQNPYKAAQIIQQQWKDVQILIDTADYIMDGQQIQNQTFCSVSADCETSIENISLSQLLCTSQLYLQSQRDRQTQGTEDLLEIEQSKIMVEQYRPSEQD